MSEQLGSHITTPSSHDDASKDKRPAAEVVNGSGIFIMADLHTGKPITLKCGLTLPNRLVKAATAESMAPNNTLPDEKFQNLYRHWAEGGWGMVLAGNVQVDANHICTATDLSVDHSLSDSKIVEAWRPWAAACNGNGTVTVMQLCHPGRQSPAGAGKRGLFAKSIAPSAVALQMGSGLVAKAVTALLFGTPREMSVSDIETVVSQFARSARLAAESGFAGVEVHAGHGFLLEQFLSTKSNRRTDAYGGTPAKRARIVVEVLTAIRAVVPAGFCVGLSLNSVDLQSQTELKDCVEQVKLITDAGVDFIEVSGGTFENPTMFLGPEKSRKQAQLGQPLAHEPFFLDFAKAIRPHVPGVPLIVTGGFRSCQGIEETIAGGDADLVGLARPAVVNPLLPKTTVLSPKTTEFGPEIEDGDVTLYAKKTEAPWILKQIGIRAVEVHIDNSVYHNRRHAAKQVRRASVLLQFPSRPSLSVAAVDIDNVISRLSTARPFVFIFLAITVEVNIDTDIAALLLALRPSPELYHLAAAMPPRRSDGSADHDVPDWPKTPHPTPYDILAMRKDDPYTKHRFFQLVKIYHPDRHGHTPAVHRLPHATRLERYRLIVAANDLLSNPSKRSLYDTQGVGWTGDRPPTLNESVRHAEKSWRHQPGNASRNATWEDWERWYDARDGKTRDPMYMSNGVFATLVVMMCMIGAFAQMSRAEQSGTEYLETRDQSNLAIGQQISRTTLVSAGRSKDERVDSFLRERENVAYEFTPSKYDDRTRTEA
uniref:NADH-dependent flavin oxidoreductase iliE n=1 Tax=Neonectria sp. (strain DH2) TaxID=1735992 RepID=ILIE_NEOS2|nr:RecName: Full=NADH-dependent flavin oxidoreductase iliE; AltName: Full=Epimerase iliE; AltName: Full=Ilicicolin H biosynthesis cluster protein E [Neonectria sp. DH2]